MSIHVCLFFAWPQSAVFHLVPHPVITWPIKKKLEFVSYCIKFLFISVLDQGNLTV